MQFSATGGKSYGFYETVLTRDGWPRNFKIFLEMTLPAAFCVVSLVFLCGALATMARSLGHGL